MPPLMEFYKDYHFEKIVERNRLFVHYIVISGFQDDIFDLFVIDIAVTLYSKVVRYMSLCDFFLLLVWLVKPAISLIFLVLSHLYVLN